MRIENRSNNTAKAILVVDADPTTRNFFVKELRNAGYFALAAKTGLYAFNLLYGRKVSLMLLDLSIPELKGEDLLALAAAEEILPRCIILRKGPPSGHATISQLPGVVGTISKTFTKEFVSDVTIYINSKSDSLFRQEHAEERFLNILDAFEIPECTRNTVKEAFFHGGTNRVISKKLGLAEVTVRNHLRRATRYIGATSVDDTLRILERKFYAPVN